MLEPLMQSLRKYLGVQFQQQVMSSVPAAEGEIHNAIQAKLPDLSQPPCPQMLAEL